MIMENNPPSSNGVRRQMMILLLGAALLLFFAVGLFVTLRFVYPRVLPTYVEIGPLSDYPPSDAPYAFREDYNLYIINNGKELIVLNRLHQNPTGRLVAVNWAASQSAYISPAGGTHYTVEGCPIYGPVNVPLTRYPVDIEAGKIRIEISSPFSACEMVNGAWIQDVLSPLRIPDR